VPTPPVPLPAPAATTPGPVNSATQGTSVSVGGVAVDVPAGWAQVPQPSAVSYGDHVDYLFVSDSDPNDQLLVVSDQCTGAPSIHRHHSLRPEPKMSQRSVQTRQPSQPQATQRPCRTTGATNVQHLCLTTTKQTESYWSDLPLAPRHTPWSL
jgi:hypothetical protein